MFDADEKSLKDEVESLIRETGVSGLSAEERDWFETVYSNAQFQQQLYRAAEREQGIPEDEQAAARTREQAKNILRWLSDLRERDPSLHTNLRAISFGEAVEYHDQWTSEAGTSR